MKRSASVPWQPPNRWNGAWPPYAFAILAGGLSGAAAWVALRQSVAWGGVLLLALSGAVAMLALNEVRRPLLALLAFSLPLHLDRYFGFFPLPSIAGGPAATLRISVNDVILAILLLLWLAEMATGRQKRINAFVDVSLPAILFLLIGAQSVVIAQEPRLAAYQGATLFQSALGLYQAVMEKPLGLTFLGERTYVRQQVFERAESVRPAGTLWHTNQLAMYLGMTLPVIASILLAPVRRGVRSLAALVLLAGLLVVGLTLSRSSWLSLLLGAVVLAAYGVKKKRISPWQLVMGGLVLAVGVIAVDLATGGIVLARLIESDRGSGMSRLPLMRGALSVWADHPVLGIGLKNYEIAIRQYDITGQFTEFGNMPIVHNILLLYLAEIGLLGMSAFVWLLVSLARRGLGFVRGREAALAPSVAVGLLVSGLVLLAHNMVHVGLGGDPQLFVVFWFLAGLLVALTSWKDAPSGFVSQQGVSRA